MIDIGSHVVLIRDDWDKECARGCGTLSWPVKGVVYTVRKILKDYSDVGIYLNEILNPICPTILGDIEPCFNIKKFRPLSKLNANDYLHVKILVDA